VASQNATTGNLANVQNTIINAARTVQEYNTPSWQLVDKVTLPKGTSTVRVPKVGQFTISELVDGQDMVDEQAIGLTSIDLTTSEKGAKIILLNARISDKSVEKYMKMAWFYKRIFAHVDLVLAQSQQDKNRLLALGAKNIEVVGNIKLAATIEKTAEYEKPDGEVIVAGSTHEGEEQAILEAFVRYKREMPESKLVIVPRHPERFDAVYALMQSYAQKEGWKIIRWSEHKEFAADLILVDMMGELNNIYAVSDVAILGGAFREDVGGHNPLEPAHFGCKIITGKHFFHQKELFRYTHHVQYVNSDEIYEALKKAQELPPSQVDEKIDMQRVIERIKEYA